jgi:hypothetical protein
VVFQDHIPDLFDLVRFPLPIFGLKVKDLLNTILGENKELQAYMAFTKKPAAYPCPLYAAAYAFYDFRNL